MTDTAYATYNGRRVFPVNAPAANTQGTVLQQAYAAMVHARNTFDKHIEQATTNRHHYTDDGYRELIAEFKTTDAAKAVDAAVEAVRARRDKAQTDLDETRRGLSQPGDAAQESRNLRY